MSPSPFSPDALARGTDGDLSSCDLEPIHIPGFIQPHGVLLALAAPSLRVLQVSANLATLTGREPEAALGRILADVLPEGSEAVPVDLRHLPPDGVHHLREVTLRLPAGDHVVHAIAHRTDSSIILELEERAGGTSGSFEDFYPLVRPFVEALNQPQSVADLCELAAREVRRITGFDRVLIYRFDEAWNGTVLAEDRNETLPAYFDLRFPASDIPAQARDLYRRNRLRLIADVDYRPVPILPPLNPVTGTPLDLSQSVLRSVSPVHLEYMRNMGTGASMSASLLCGGRLWGLISCHNETPHRPPFHVRAACEHVAQIMAVQIQALERARDVDQRMALRAIQVQLLAQIAEEGAMVDGLTKDSELLLSFAAADGAAVVFGGEVRRLGRTPTASQIDTIVHWLNHRPGLSLHATERVSADIPETAHSTDVASGLLAIAISEKPRGYVLWFRPEVVRTVKWSGDPNNAKEFTPADARIHPRKSFELWKEVVRQSAMPWSAPLRVAASELRAALLGVAQRSAAPAGSGTPHETEEGERRS